MIPPFWVIKKLFYLSDSEYEYSILDGAGIAIIEGHKVSFLIDSDGRISHMVENDSTIIS